MLAVLHTARKSNINSLCYCVGRQLGEEGRKSLLAWGRVTHDCTWRVHWANILTEFLNLAQPCVQYLGSLALPCIIIPLISIPQAQPPHDSITPRNRVSLRHHSLWSLVVIPGCVRFSILQVHTIPEALHNWNLPISSSSSPQVINFVPMLIASRRPKWRRIKHSFTSPIA